MNENKTKLSAITLADIFNARTIGFACTRAWAYVMFFSTVIHLSTRNDIAHLNSTDTWSSLGMGLFMILGAFIPRLFQRYVIRHRWPRIVVPIMLCLATGLLSLIEADFFQQPWCSIITTLSGVGLGFFYLAWGEAYSRLDQRKVAIETLSSFFIAALIFPALIVVPHLVAIALTMILPLIAGYLAFAKVGIWKHAPLLEPVRVKKGGFFLKAILSVGLLGFIEALMRNIFIEINPVTNSELYPWVFLIATLVAGVIIAVGINAGNSPDFGFAYRVILLVLAFILLLLPIFERGSMLADTLTLVSYCTVSLLVWIVLARVSGSFQLSPVIVFGFGWGAMVSGALIGTFIAGLLKSFVEMSHQFLYSSALFALVVLLFAYLFLFNERSIIRLTREEDSETEGFRPFRTRCEEVAKQYGLTEKETEIMILIAKGRSAPRICEELDISQGTVNTHLTHLYRKMDIHDKQELLDILEGRLD